MTSMFKSVIKKLTPEEVPLGDDQMIIKIKRLDSRYNRRGHVELVEAGAAPIRKPDHDPYNDYVLQFVRYYNQLGILTRRTLEIKSTLLKKVLKEIIEDYPGISFQTANVCLEYPLRVLWYYRAELQAARDIEKKSEKGRHIALLIDFLNEEFRQTDKDYKNYLAEGLINFDLLWTLFKPKELVYTTFHGDARVFEAKGYKEICSSEGTFGAIESTCVDYDGERFGWATNTLLNPYFEGTKKIVDLAAYPLKYHPDSQQVQKALIARGHKFVSLQGVHCMEYCGNTISSAGHWGSKLHVNGRVMVDVATHILFHPEKAKSLESLMSDRTRKAEEGPQIDRARLDEMMYYGQDYPRAELSKPAVLGKADGQDLKISAGKEKLKMTEKLMDDQALLCNSVIWGFALTEKQWVQFFVNKLQPVQWNARSFDQLVLPAAQKQLVRALVESHKGSGTRFDDFIAGKGQGLIACLHGPPGCGKTFTAESVAEYTKSPLYTISAGDLGADASDLEAVLTKTLRLCTIWNAVLLLDEADVFLEERSLHDLKRNALVSIFLRLLEYYRGILFLTTNRVKTFDEAFQSRIHIALRYRDLDIKAREQVWRNFIRKIESDPQGLKTNVSESDYEFLASVNLNGRQIKNTARTALSLADNEGQKLDVQYVKNVLGVVEAFERDFMELRVQDST